MYHFTEDSTDEGNDFHAATSIIGSAQIVSHEGFEAISANIQEINLASPMHFRRVPRQNNQDRFALVTSENQLKIDVGKDYCTRGCMSAIGKDKLQSLRRYCFSLTIDE